MDPKQQLEALQDIRQMMNRSVRFLSLSGLSGFFAGLYATVAGYLAYDRIGNSLHYASYSYEDGLFFISLGCTTLFLTIVTSYILTSRKAKEAGVSLWDETARLALTNLSIPLLAGGVFCLSLINLELFGLLAPVTLIFYGLALVNVSKHTFPQVRQLGLIEIVLGLVNAFFVGYGLIFWVLGFGLLHIVYGVYMHFKYDRK